MDIKLGQVVIREVVPPLRVCPVRDLESDVAQEVGHLFRWVNYLLNKVSRPTGQSLSVSNFWGLPIRERVPSQSVPSQCPLCPVPPCPVPWARVASQPSAPTGRDSKAQVGAQRRPGISATAIRRVRNPIGARQIRISAHRFRREQTAHRLPGRAQNAFLSAYHEIPVARSPCFYGRVNNSENSPPAILGSKRWQLLPPYLGRTPEHEPHGSGRHSEGRGPLAAALGRQCS